jgi:transcriptional regulator of acetoin/glycerol metabolism
MRSQGAHQFADLPSAVQNYIAGNSLAHLSEAVSASPGQSPLPSYHRSAGSPVISIRESERQTIHAALAATHGERGRAADLLKISRTTLYRRMKQYGLQ